MSFIKHKQKGLKDNCARAKPFWKYVQHGVFLSIALLALYPHAVLGWTFDPHNIITDAELKDQNGLSKTAIQTFLEREGSALKTYRQNVEGKNLTAAEMIWEISQKYGISPKFLLTQVEKEKGLIQKTSASDKDYDWATGYSCFNNRCNDKYKGFYNQVESTAITQNIYFERSSTFQFRPGQTAITKEGYAIAPKNQATANLYIYTPYVGYAPDYGYTNIEKTSGRFGANFLFWQIWTRYFTEKKIPNGFVIKNGDNFWLVEKGKKRKFFSKEIFLKDYREDVAIFVSQKTLDAYEDSPVILFANNTLVRSDATNQAYLITNNAKRPIVDNAALALLTDFRLAVNSLEEITPVSNELLAEYSVGNPIDGNTKYPQGKLFSDETDAIFFVQDGFKYPVDRTVWQINFYGAQPEKTSRLFLEAFITGEPLKLKNGSVVRNAQGFIYVISDNEKIKIKYEDIFPTVFGEPYAAQLLTVPDEILALHEDGLNISYANDAIQDPPPQTQPSSGAPVTWSAELVDTIPQSIVGFAGLKKKVDMVIRNNGTAVWDSQNIWIEIEGYSERFFAPQTSISYGADAVFSVEVPMPTSIGLNEVRFSVWRADNENPTILLTFGKFVLVQSGDTAEIVSHTIPVAVKNNWKPITIAMKIKNTSDELVWLSRKSALEIYDAEGKTSPFYDPNDWVRKEVAAVPVNKIRISPGETGEFKFTLKLQGVKPGTHVLRFRLNLLDKNKKVYIEGQDFWERLIRVDK